MIDWTPLTRDVLEALAAGPIGREVQLRIAGAAAEQFTADRRTFAFEVLKEETAWNDRERARRARVALREPLARDMVASVIRLKILELADEVAAMTGHERVALRRRLSA